MATPEQTEQTSTSALIRKPERRRGQEEYNRKREDIIRLHFEGTTPKEIADKLNLV
jgi:hypothetical protein